MCIHSGFETYGQSHPKPRVPSGPTKRVLVQQKLIFKKEKKTYSALGYDINPLSSLFPPSQNACMMEITPALGRGWAENLPENVHKIYQIKWIIHSN